MSQKKTNKRLTNPPSVTRPESSGGVQPVVRSISSATKKWLALAIAVFGFLLYANTIGHDYVLDDFSVIKENFVTKEGIEGIPTHFQHHSRHGYWNSPGELYRPFTMAMFCLEWEIAPDQPWLSHFINVLLYALSGAILFLTLSRVMKGYHLLLPLLGTLFFMAHPVHVEVVANIKSRDEIVMFLCSVLAINWLWKYLEGGRNSSLRSRGWLALALLSYMVALFSKENAVTFVAIVPLVMYFFPTYDFNRGGLGRIAAMTALFAVPALLFVLVRSSVIGDLTNPGETYVLDNFLVGATNGGERIASVFLLLGKYLWSLIFPQTLCSDWGYSQIPLTGWSDWRVLLSLAAWLGMGVFALIRLKNRDLWAFAILFFFINFSIFTNLFIEIGTSYGDRLLYSASPGFALALGLLLMKIFKIKVKESTAHSGNLFQHKALWLTAGAILVLYSLKTFSRNFDWKDSYTLYEADIETAPNSAKLNFHYGLEIVQKGLDAPAGSQEQKLLYERARKRFETAIQIYPKYHDAYSQLGLTYYRDGNKDKAMENYQLAIQHKANFPLVYSNMGILYFERGDLEKAKECYVKAVGYDPRMVDALRNLGAVHAMQKNFQEAIKQFSQALTYSPDDPTINFYLGSAYRDAGEEPRGRPYLEKAYRLDPKLKK